MRLFNNIMDCNYEPTGINAQFGINSMNNNCMDDKPCCNEPAEKLLEDIRCLTFAITDLALYLDTHPQDKRALCLHNEYCTRWHELQAKYQKMCGPLTIECPCNSWRWLEEPWPWEGSER